MLITRRLVSSVTMHLNPYFALPIVPSTLVTHSVVCIFWFLSGYIYPGVGLLYYMVVLFLVFWGASILFSVMALPIYIPTNKVGGFPFLYILLLFVSVLMMAILTRVMWHLIVGLICIYLKIISDVIHVFTCSLAICMSSLDKCLSRPSARFWLGCLWF